MTIQEDLRKAADLLDEHGFCQFQLTTEDGQICLLQALRLATDHNQVRIDRAAHVIMKHNESFDGINAFLRPQAAMCDINNLSGQTKEKLTAMLREIADELPADAS